MANQVANNAYSKVEFANTNPSSVLTINKAIVNAITFSNGGYSRSVKTLNLGQTTLPGLNANVFTKDDGQAWQINNISVTDLTLPLVPAGADGQVVVPSNVISCYSTNAVVEGCEQLKTVRIPEGYQKLGDQAFFGLSSVANFILPTTVTSIGNSAFENSGSITWMNLPSHLTYIGKRAYMGTKLTGMEFPSTLDKIDDAAFANIVEYDKVVLNEGLRFIGNSAFILPSAITKEVLNVPASVKYMGPASFGFRYYRDVYYNSDVAPVAPLGNSCVNNDCKNVSPFFADMYEGFNGNQSAPSARYPLADNNLVDSGEIDPDPANDTEKHIMYGYANRENYQNNVGGVDRYFSMLHFPANLPVEQYDTYKDHTRIYLTNSGTYKHDFNNTTFGGCDIPVPEGSEPEKQKTFNGSTTSAGYEGRYNNVSSGYVDTYRGDQYVWPSQGQWERAFVEASLGYCWNGIDTYRPTLTADQIALMVEDGEVCIDGVAVDLTASKTYTEDEVNAYNATLPGAWIAGTVKETWTAEDALSYNAGLEGHVEAGQSMGEYTAEEAIAYNATLEGAIKAGDAKETWTEDDANTNNAALSGAKHENDPVYPTEAEVLDHNANFDGAKHEGDEEPGKEAVFMTWAEYIETPSMKALAPDYNFNGSNHGETEYTAMLNQYKSNTSQPVYSWYGYPVDPLVSAAVSGFTYTAEQAAAYNAANNPDPWTTSTVIRNVTAEEANAYNATLVGAVKTGDTKVAYTAEEAIENNANLTGAVKENDSKGEYTAETAAAYNATLTGAVKAGDTKSTYTAEEANAHNATLDGHQTAGTTVANTEFYADGLSKIAYMGTRQFVFADGDAQPVKPSDDEPTPPGYEITMEGHHWWTLCVPFNMTKKMIDESFGEGTHVCLFSGVDRDVTKEVKRITLKFQHDVYAHKTEKNLETGVYASNFSATAAAVENDDDIVIYAHEPYMIWPTLTTADATFVVKDYELQPGSPVPTIVKASDNAEYRFIGNYIATIAVESDNTNASREATLTTVKVPAYSYVYAKTKNAVCDNQNVDDKQCSQHKFWFVKNNANTWKPNKCIVLATAKDGGSVDYTNFFGGKTSSVKQISLFGENSFEEETAIENVTVIAGEDTEATYNLNGQLVNPNNLKKGVYIKNGKKILVR